MMEHLMFVDISLMSFEHLKLLQFTVFVDQ